MYRHRDPLTLLKIQRGAEFIVELGPRAVAELLWEIGEQLESMPLIIRLLAEYRGRLTLEQLQAVGADRFPPSVRRVA